MSCITTEQIENIIIDAGVVYLNYGEEDQKILAPTRGGNAFEVTGEIREIEVNNVRGKTKGLRRKIREEANLTVTVMDLNLENLALALPSSNLDVGGDKLSAGWKVTDDDYLKNVTLIGETLGGAYKKISIYNAMVDGDFAIEFEEDDEGTVELNFSAHHALCPVEGTDVLWDIEDLTELV